MQNETERGAVQRYDGLLFKISLLWLHTQFMFFAVSHLPKEWDQLFTGSYIQLYIAVVVFLLTYKMHSLARAS